MRGTRYQTGGARRLMTWRYQ